jgi:cytochrome P450
VQVYGSHVGVYHELHPFFFAIQQFLAKFGRSGNGQDTLLKFASEQIKARQEAVKGVQQKAIPSDDFLAKVLEKHEANPEFFTMADVLQACSMNIGAGSDTTGISLTAIMWFLIKNPHTLFKVGRKGQSNITAQD